MTVIARKTAIHPNAKERRLHFLRFVYVYQRWSWWIIRFYFSSFEAGIANAIFSFKWRKIKCSINTASLPHTIRRILMIYLGVQNYKNIWAAQGCVPTDIPQLIIISVYLLVMTELKKVSILNFNSNILQIHEELSQCYHFISILNLFIMLCIHCLTLFPPSIYCKFIIIFFSHIVVYINLD